MRPFEGLLVVDLSHVLAGPFCTYQLALLGAEVLKIEPPDGGDYMRRRGSDPDLRVRLMGDHFLCQNANKKSLVVDVRTAEGLDVVRRLAIRADVLVCNFRPPVMEHLGLGYSALRAENPRLVYCTLSAYGASGPWAARGAYDNVVQAVCGLMDATGTDSSGPIKAGTPVLDYASGTMAAFAVASALLQRERGGAGQHIDVSMLDTALMLMSPSIMSFVQSGVAPTRHANEHPLAAASCYRCADGELLMLGCCTQRQFERLCLLIGAPELLADPRFCEVQAHDPHRGALAEALAAHIQTRTAAAWESILADQVPAARVRTLPETLALDQIGSRAVLGKIPPQGAGDLAGLAVPLAAFSFAHDGPRLDAAPPPLGAHTVEALRAHGFSETDVAGLIERGIVRGPAP